MTEELIEDVESEEGKVSKSDYKFRISENYAIDTDSRNFILLERYEKRKGRGIGAELSGEFAWKHLGYFQSYNRMADVLVDMNIFSNEDKVIVDLYAMADEVKELKKDMRKLLNEIVKENEKS